jgi:hypothetical protein
MPTIKQIIDRNRARVTQINVEQDPRARITRTGVNPLSGLFQDGKIKDRNNRPQRPF